MRVGGPTIRRCFLAGCLIVLSWADSDLRGQAINFNDDIAPLVFQHCTPCHQRGGAGPMPFTNYEETVAYGAMIAYVTRTRYMPPWKAQPGYGHFQTDLSLHDEQIESIQRWMVAGFPEGPGEPPTFGQTLDKVENDDQRDWDLEIEMDTAFEQYDIYFDQFQVFRLQTGLRTDRWVEAVEFVPGDRTIVRYASVALSGQPVARRLDRWDPRYGYTSFGGPGFMPDQDNWFTWTIGDEQPVDGESIRYLPAGADLLLYVHYGPTGVKKLDRSRLRLKFVDDPGKLPVRRSASLINPTLLRNGSFSVEAGNLKTVHAQTVLPEAIELVALEPHGLLLNRSWEVFARLPEGQVIPLLKIEDYDFHWRREYQLAKPVLLPAGTMLHGRATYDNRPENPFLPVSPPVTATWGYRLYNEQFQVRFHYHLPKNRQINLLPGVANQTSERRTIRFSNPDAQRLTLVVKNFGASEDVIRKTLNQSLPGWNELEFELDGLAYGNYHLKLLDENGRALASEFFVYWPPEMTKSLLDE